MEATLVLTPAMLGDDLAAIARARRWVRGFLDERAPGDDDSSDDLVSTATLVVSELVTNAIIHAKATPHVMVSLHHRRLVIAVDDPDADASRVEPLQSSVDRIGGRGLAIVGQVAQRWGVEPVSSQERHGKRVWAELDLGDQPGV